MSEIRLVLVLVLESNSDDEDEHENEDECGKKSVSIRVHPWLNFPGNYGFQKTGPALPRIRGQ